MQPFNDDPPGAGRMNNESYIEALERTVARDRKRKDRVAGMYWLVELHDGPHATMYLEIPPRRGYPCGFTFNPGDAFAYKSEWRARFVAWRLSRRGIGVIAAPHIWM